MGIKTIRYILMYTKFYNLSISNINIRSIQNRNLKNAEGSCNVRKMNRYFTHFHVRYDLRMEADEAKSISFQILFS